MVKVVEKIEVPPRFGRRPELIVCRSADRAYLVDAGSMFNLVGSGGKLRVHKDEESSCVDRKQT
jgi:hypothetical protein